MYISDMGENGETYLLTSPVNGRKYVLKKSTNKERLRREGKILRNLAGSEFPKWYAEYEEGKYYYLVREYKEGETLEEWLKQEGRNLSLQSIMDIMEEVLETLEKLHRQEPPILYRDVTPSNLVLDKEGRIQLVDFGISLMQGEEKQKAGTLGYAAPEQFEEDTEDKNVDIYGAGALLACLLMGKEPSGLCCNIREECLRNKKIAKGWKYIVAKSMETEPNRRYPDTAAMLFDMKRVFFEKKKWRRGISRKHSIQNIKYEQSVWIRGEAKRCM